MRRPCPPVGALAALRPPRKPRRPVAEEMLSIRVRDVRPLVEVGQESVQLPEIGRPLTLLWRWRSGGCLGPQAAAAMNSRQRIPRRGAVPVGLGRRGNAGEARQTPIVGKLVPVQVVFAPTLDRVAALP